MCREDMGHSRPSRAGRSRLRLTDLALVVRGHDVSDAVAQVDVVPREGRRLARERPVPAEEEHEGVEGGVSPPEQLALEALGTEPGVDLSPASSARRSASRASRRRSSARLGRVLRGAGRAVCRIRPLPRDAEPRVAVGSRSPSRANRRRGPSDGLESSRRAPQRHGRDRMRAAAGAPHRSASARSRDSGARSSTTGSPSATSC